MMLSEETVELQMNWDLRFLNIGYGRKNYTYNNKNAMHDIKHMNKILADIVGHSILHIVSQIDLPGNNSHSMQDYANQII